MSKIILASKSPRRKEILNQVGIDFEIVVSDKDEELTTDIPSDIVQELSRQKAEDVQNKVKDSDYIIIAADTVVAVDDNILGKPKDKDDAFNMIKLIEGRNHSVYTGVTLLKKDRENVTIRTFYEETVVEVYPMTEEEIYRYLDFNQWEDKAGGYGIQGSFAAYVKAIKGDYYTVVGLPISRIIYEMKNLS